MTTHYTLEENDFITHQLYIVSVSKRVKASRRKNRILISLILIGGSIVPLLVGDTWGGLLFCLMGIALFFLYPLWDRRWYVRHYTTFVRENFQDRMGKEISFHISDDQLYATTATEESKINTSEIEQVTEIPTLLVIQMKGAHHFVLPKHKMPDAGEVTNRLRLLATHLGIDYVHVNKWEWK